MGEKLCFDIKCSDETFTPNQTVPDTVAVWWDTAIRTASFSIKNPKDREKTAQFCWEPHDSDYRDTRYRFTVYTSDQHCDYTTISSRTFLVRVAKKAIGKMDIKKGPCGRLYLSAQKDSSYNGDATFQWQIKNSVNAMVLNSKKPKDTLSYLPEGDYYIKLTTNNKVGCATYSFDTIHLGPLPHVYLGADTFVCDKTNFLLSPKNISHATAPFTYRWSAIGNNTFTDTNSFFNLIKASKDTTITLKITDSLGCVFRDTIVVLLKPLPQLDAGENKVICTYQTAQLKATAKPEYGAFLWSTNDTAQSISTNKKGTYTVTYTEPEFSCKNTDSVVVIVNDTVRAIAGVDQSICGSGSVTFNANHQPVNWAVNYLWTDLTNNTDISTKSKLDITKSNTVLGAADLVYRYKLKVTLSQNGLVCTNSDTAKLTVHSKPLAKWTVPKITRCHSEGDFLLEPFIEQPDSSLWLNGRFRIYGSGGKYNLVDSISVNEHWGRLTYLDNESDLNGGKSFTQKITVWAQDTNGCSNTSTIDLRIHGNPTIVLDTSYYCQDKGFAHLDSSVMRPKTKLGNAQKWDVLSVPSGVDPTKVLIDSSGTGTKWVLLFGKPSENFYSGNYQLKFTVKDLVSGCQSQETTEVRVFPEPILTATDPQPFCKFGQYDLTSIFLADNKPPSAQNSWFKIHSFNGNTDSKEFGSAMINKNIFTADKAGLWNFIVKNTETGCESTDTFRLESKDNPQALFSILPSDSVSIDNTTIKFSNQSSIDSQDPLAYSWFFNYPSHSQSSNLPSPWYTYPKADSSYTIRLIAQTYWCSDTMEKILVVGNGHWNSINPIFIQAIHFDNFFKPLGLEGKNYLLQVYDVTGKMVGHTKENMGLSLSAGNYFYVLQVENRREKPLVFRGQHTILAP
ncbi:MAG: hypothetical protein IT244_12260 [Bacteroidia bacterium]|nr:hypothetical protein [Bacteroidia bacterium]